MNYNIIKDLFIRQFDRNPAEISIFLTYGFITLENQVVMPIKVSNIFNRSNLIQIEDENSAILGELYLIRENKYEVNSMPETLYKIYLCENESELNIGQHQDYQFKYDYLLIDVERAEEYFTNYKQNSFLWGDFCHIENEISHGLDFNTGLTKLTTINSARIDSQIRSIHIELISESNCFHRFLKYYHLLEMHFDMHTAKKISAYFSKGGKEKEISSLLRDYNREDLNRLESLIENFVNPLTLQNFLKEIFNHESHAKNIFYKFGKESNPLKSYKDFEKLKRGGMFSENITQNVRGQSTHNKFLTKISAYWIYRVRSSIAHRKLGEYVMDDKDRKFIINFAEPLIKAIYRDFYLSFNNSDNT